MRVSALAFVAAAAGLGIGLSGCAGFGGAAPAVTPAMAVASGHGLATLRSGRELFAMRCTSCHNADPVSSRDADAWRRVVDQMAERAKLQAGERAALLAYLAAAQNPGGASAHR